MVIEFFGGKLPWQNSTDICFITQCKERLHLRENDKFRNDLFVGMPQELHTCFRYIIAVDFCEIPDYSYLFKLFECILKTSKVPDKFFVDWDSSKSYSPPPYAKKYSKNMDESGPIYKLSQKRINFNVICRGTTYNFSHLTKNGFAVFRCVNEDVNGKNVKVSFM
uniref:Uncharacterized protein n=1 Tax=Panagrolaimus superbus TaxID=310955 RepID=A0A914YGY0_9BILA